MIAGGSLLTVKGKSVSAPPPPPMEVYPVMLGSLAVRTRGGVPSKDSALASFPFPYSKKMP